MLYPWLLFMSVHLVPSFNFCANAQQLYLNIDLLLHAHIGTQ